MVEAWKPMSLMIAGNTGVLVASPMATRVSTWFTAKKSTAPTRMIGSSFAWNAGGPPGCGMSLKSDMNPRATARLITYCEALNQAFHHGLRRIMSAPKVTMEWTRTAAPTAEVRIIANAKVPEVVNSSSSSARGTRTGSSSPRSRKPAKSQNSLEAANTLWTAPEARKYATAPIPTTDTAAT